MTPSFLRLATILLGGVLFATASAAAVPVHIVTSIPPLAMLAAEFGGDRVVVHSILPPGADPHTFEPKPSDAAAVAGADLVIVLGSSIDDWIADALRARDGASVVRLDDTAGTGDEEGGHDPHVWLDPTWVRERVVPALQRAMSAADPEGAPRYGVAARAMGEHMLDLEEDVREAFQRAATRNFLAWHPAWQRFAARFGLHSVSALGESEGREPSLGAMIAAVRGGRAAGVRAVLVEPQIDSRQAAVLADELGVAMVTVDPMGDSWSADRATYRELMMFNARAFAIALAVPHDDDEKKAPVSALPATPASR